MVLKNLELLLIIINKNNKIKKIKLKSHLMISSLVFKTCLEVKNSHNSLNKFNNNKKIHKKSIFKVTII